MGTVLHNKYRSIQPQVNRVTHRRCNAHSVPKRVGARGRAFGPRNSEMAFPRTIHTESVPLWENPFGKKLPACQCEKNSNFTSLCTCAKISGAQPVQVIAAEQTKGFRRGKSGLHRAGCRITSGGGNSQTSATEINRLASAG